MAAIQQAPVQLNAGAAAVIPAAAQQLAANNSITSPSYPIASLYRLFGNHKKLNNNVFEFYSFFLNIFSRRRPPLRRHRSHALRKVQPMRSGALDPSLSRSRHQTIFRLRVRQLPTTQRCRTSSRHHELWRLERTTNANHVEPTRSIRSKIRTRKHFHQKLGQNHR